MLRSGREKRLASDHSITVRGNQWYDHATEKGGCSIDFVRMFYNQSFPDAVTMLLGGEQGEAYREKHEAGTGTEKTIYTSGGQSDDAPGLCISGKDTLSGS